MELILGLIILALLARVGRSNKGNYFSTIDDHKSLVEKWTPILDFGIYDPSGVLTSPPISERDKPMVAILFEQKEFVQNVLKQTHIQIENIMGIIQNILLRK
jgi:hypothetical protein